MAGQESKGRSERIKAGLARRKAQGMPIGGRVPGSKDKRASALAMATSMHGAMVASAVRPPAPSRPSVPVSLPPPVDLSVAAQRGGHCMANGD